MPSPPREDVSRGARPERGSDDEGFDDELHADDPALGCRVLQRTRDADECEFADDSEATHDEAEDDARKVDWKVEQAIRYKGEHDAYSGPCGKADEQDETRRKKYHQEREATVSMSRHHLNCLP